MNNKLFFLFWLISGCFNLRTPEEPKTAAKGDLTVASEPSVLISNLSESVKNLNIENYKRCFNKDFIFNPDPSVSRSNSGIFSGWDIDNENEYINNIKNKTIQTNRNVLSFDKSETKFISPDSAEFISDYNLFLNHTVNNVPTNYKGNMRLIIIKNNYNEWEIIRWTDNKNSTKPCWTNLKLYFSN